MTTIKKLYAHSGNYSKSKNAKKYIVVHNTGNTASAKSEATYAHNNAHKSSYHYVLDGKGTIYKVVPDKYTAYAVGCANWKGAKALVRNGESISIEVCSNGKKFTDAEIAELTWLVKRLMKRYSIPAKRVVRHWDCHTGRKECPAYYCGSTAADKRWKALWKKITGSK